ncbi:MAG: hypothetical protein ACRET8_10715 [Burkholderiales bacterium]
MAQILQEYRFPLHLEPTVESIWALYSRAKNERWDPSRSIAWDKLEAERHAPQLREAARLVWSHRAWLLFGRLSETPALLVRFCLERQRESDPKYFLSLRGTDEAWHLDVCHRLASGFGGFIAEPRDPAYAAQFNQTLHREVLDADFSLDAHVGAYVALREHLEAALLGAARSATTDPVIGSALDFMLRDKHRHAQFGWLYLAERAAQFDDDARGAIAARATGMMERFYASGLMVPALAPAVAGDVAAAYETTAAAGLGAAPLPAQRDALRGALDEAQAKFAALGIRFSGILAA